MFALCLVLGISDVQQTFEVFFRLPDLHQCPGAGVLLEVMLMLMVPPLQDGFSS